ncbi:hypothetical protein LAD77_02220 [Klebsiella pneumoniae]|nr:hypothetical protein [Klebsiella pneumoniae]
MSIYDPNPGRCDAFLISSFQLFPKALFSPMQEHSEKKLRNIVIRVGRMILKTPQQTISDCSSVAAAEMMKIAGKKQPCSP